MVRFLKEWTKQAATTLLNVHRPSEKKDILILSAPRSGSTWLMEVLYSEPGMKFINEPLGKRILDYWDFLPIETRWNYIDLSRHEKKVLKEYFTADDLIGHFGPRNPFHPDYDLFTDRRVIKTVRANPLIEWFLDEFDFQVIYLLRHPIAQTLSSLKRGHHHQIEDFLDSETYRERLSDRQLEFAEEAASSDDRLRQFVTQWVLDNFVPLGLHDHPSLTIITYEELVCRFPEFVSFFCERFGLTGETRILSKENRPSRTSDSSGRETQEKIRDRNKTYLIRKWEEEVSKGRARELLDIQEIFDRTIYSAGRSFADSTFLRFEKPAG